MKVPGAVDFGADRGRPVVESHVFEDGVLGDDAVSIPFSQEWLRG